MIDFHNHVIPNVDDGSKSIKMSLSMLKKASDMGVKTVINTTHYNHPGMKERFPDFKKINLKLNQLEQEMLSKSINIDILSSAEVYFNEEILGFCDDKNIIIADKYMLIEFDFMFIPNNYENILFQLQLNGITPIIAHPERYKFVQNNHDYIKNWINKGYKLQLTCGSILGYFGESCLSTSHKIINEGNFHLIGSDAHNDGSRNFAIKDCFDLIKEKSEENYQILKENHQNLFDGGTLNSCVKIQKENTIFTFFKKLVNY